MRQPHRPHPLGSRWMIVTAFLVVAVNLGPQAAVSAQPQIVDERELDARKLYAQGRYDEAIELFSELYAESGDPVFLRNLGRCYQKARRPQAAIDRFRDYLARGRTIGPGERREIEGYIAEMEALKKAQNADPAGSAALSGPATNGQEISPVFPAPEPPDLRPDVPAASRGAAGALTEPRPAPVNHRPFYKKWWFWGAVGAATVAVVASALVIGGGGQVGTCPGGAIPCQEIGE